MKGFLRAHDDIQWGQQRRTMAKRKWLKQVTLRVTLVLLLSSYRPPPLISMAEILAPATNDTHLSFLKMASKWMLHESGNQVYLKMKAELQQLRYIYVVFKMSWFAHHICNDRSLLLAAPGESLATESHPTCLEDHPVLAIQMSRSGARLVYRVRYPLAVVFGMRCDSYFFTEVQYPQSDQALEDSKQPVVDLELGDITLVDPMHDSKMYGTS